MTDLYKVSSSPHIRSKISTRSIMLDVVIALLPAVGFSVYWFGTRALIIIILSILSCVVSEALWQYLRRRYNKNEQITVSDCSAILTGLLLALNLPDTVPYWIPIVGGAFAIIIVKQFFGGIGQNFMNPALAARAFLLASWPKHMTIFQLDGVTTATPLDLIKHGSTDLPSFTDVFIGNIGGCIGEISALALLLGGVYLLIRKVISWEVPVTFIASVFILTYVFDGNGAYEIFTGGLMLGAFFMATDYSTSPITSKGKIIMGLGCGLITVIIRKFGGYPEGVSYSILVMNLVVPLIDRYTKPRIFGEVSSNEK